MMCCVFVELGLKVLSPRWGAIDCWRILEKIFKDVKNTHFFILCGNWENM